MKRPLNLDAIQARADAATPGPWWTSGAAIYTGEPAEDVRRSTWVGQTYTPNVPDWGGANAQFIAHARTDVDQLLARVRDLEAALAKYVGHEPTIAEEMAHMRGCLNAVDDVATRWADHCLSPQTRQLLDDVRAALDGQPAT